jgi:predicted transposase/invertase (TIGR01784 family)
LKGEKIMAYITTWERRGKEKGKLEGEIEGEKKNALKNAKNMLKKSYDLKEISEITGLSIEDIEKLK